MCVSGRMGVAQTLLSVLVLGRAVTNHGAVAIPALFATIFASALSNVSAIASASEPVHGIAEHLQHCRHLRFASAAADALGDVEDAVDAFTLQRFEHFQSPSEADWLVPGGADGGFQRLDRFDRVELFELIALGARRLEVVGQPDAHYVSRRFFLMFTPRGMSRTGCGSKRSAVRFSSLATPRSSMCSRSLQRSHSCDADGTSS